MDNRGNRIVTTTIKRDMATPITTPDPGLPEWKWSRGDQFNTSDSDKLKEYANEFVTDAYWKCRQTDGLRDYYSTYISFQVGYVIGLIREKFRRLMAFYRQLMSRQTRRTKFLGPTLYAAQPYYYFYIFDHIHTLGMDIEKLVDLLDETPEELLIDVFTEGYKPNVAREASETEQSDQTTTVKRRKTLRSNISDMSVEIDLSKIKSFKEQEKQKILLRQQYLMTKKSKPLHSSMQKKTVKNQWPLNVDWDEIVEQSKNYGNY